jgi:hypothetical protein
MLVGGQQYRADGYGIVDLLVIHAVMLGDWSSVRKKQVLKRSDLFVGAGSQ